MTTMADAHREWHRNAGVPMGTPGCPQDACHPAEPWCYDCGDTDPQCWCQVELAAIKAEVSALAADADDDAGFDPPF